MKSILGLLEAPYEAASERIGKEHNDCFERVTLPYDPDQVYSRENVCKLAPVVRARGGFYSAASVVYGIILSVAWAVKAFRSQSA
jgi:hypothetical protein